jgi:hypothetical protein
MCGVGSVPVSRVEDWQRRMMETQYAPRMSIDDAASAGPQWAGVGHILGHETPGYPSDIMTFTDVRYFIPENVGVPC